MIYMCERNEGGYKFIIAEEHITFVHQSVPTLRQFLPLIQIGDGNADHGFWGRPEDMTMNRPSFRITSSKPGSDLAGETAAALAASSMFYKAIGDSSAASEALSHARTLFRFADEKRAKYTDSVPEAASFYK